MNIVIIEESVDRRCYLPLEVIHDVCVCRLPFTDQTSNIIYVWHNDVADILLGGVSNVPPGETEVFFLTTVGGNH